MVTNQNCDVRTIAQKRQLVWHTTLHSPGVFLPNTKTEQAAWGSLLFWWEAVPPFHLRSLCAKDGQDSAVLHLKNVLFVTQPEFTTATHIFFLIVTILTTFPL